MPKSQRIQRRKLRTQSRARACPRLKRQLVSIPELELVGSCLLAHCPFIARFSLRSWRGVGGNVFRVMRAMGIGWLLGKGGRVALRSEVGLGMWEVACRVMEDAWRRELRL